MTGPRGRSAWRTLPVSLLLLTASIGRWADAQSVPDADREQAVRLVAEADRARASGDRAAAVRALLRAVRWDPSRRSDYRRAVSLLVRIDPEAAVRHAALLLDADPDFGRGVDPLMKRLRIEAMKIDTAGSWTVAAQISQRLAGFAADPIAAAPLWNDTGCAYVIVDRADVASDAFARFQDAVAGGPELAPAGAAPWEVIAGAHLDAGRPNRAAVAIDFLEQQAGETASVARLRGRLAIALEEPLAAVEHAKRAVELAWASDEEDVIDAPYATLVEALDAINQGDQAIESLQQYRERRPDDVPLAMTLVDALAKPSPRRARRECERLVNTIVSAAPQVDPLFDSAESPLPSEVLPVAIRRCLGLGVSGASGFVESLPGWASRLGPMESLADLLATAPLSGEAREAAARWSRGVAQRAAEGSTPVGGRRAAAAVGIALGDDATVAACIQARLGAAADADVDFADVEREIIGWTASLFATEQYHAVARAIRWVIPWLEQSFPEDGRLGDTVARFRLDLADALIETLPDDPAGRVPVVNDVVELIALSEAAAGDDPFLAYSSMMLLRACDETDRAIAAGERCLAKSAETKPPEGARVVLSDLLAIRDRQGDQPRASELLESVLDDRPDDATALNNLAYLWSDPGDPLARAERMARRAVALRPTVAAYYDTLGWVLLRSGQREEAAEVLRQAVELADPEDAELAGEHYAAALRALGRAEEAEATVE